MEQALRADIWVVIATSAITLAVGGGLAVLVAAVKGKRTNSIFMPREVCHIQMAGIHERLAAIETGQKEMRIQLVEMDKKLARLCNGNKP